MNQLYPTGLPQENKVREANLMSIVASTRFITKLQCIDFSTGTAFRAEVGAYARYGTIENTGRGGETMYRPNRIKTTPLERWLYTLNEYELNMLVDTHEWNQSEKKKKAKQRREASKQKQAL